MKYIRCWVVSVDDACAVATLSRKKRDAIGKTVSAMEQPWSKLYRQGFRCVKVTVTEGWTDA